MKEVQKMQDTNYLIQLEVSTNLFPDELSFDSEDKSPAERLLEAFHYKPKTLWAIGGDDAQIQLFTELKDKIDVLAWEYAGDETLAYLAKHSVDDIFAGKNPDMVPVSVSVVEGGSGVVRIDFKCSESIKTNEFSEIFLLNRDLDEPRIGVMVKGRKEKYLIGYSDTDKAEPFVKVFYEDGMSYQMTFDINSKC